MKSPRKFTKDEKASLSHALLHTRKNLINCDARSGWYVGRRDHFIKRHNKALSLLRELIGDET
jgi:hypothetical protein